MKNERGRPRKEDSRICPHCHKGIKAHKGNTKDFRELTSFQMISSFGISLVNMKRALRCMVEKGIDVKNFQLRAVKDIFLID